jgi:ATP-dependent Clp endopeptidase proteolytic subunit ClpP
MDLPQSPEKAFPRTISLYGDVTEKMGEEVVNTLLYLNDNGYYQQESVENPEEVLVLQKPIKMIVSTYGGSAAEMFSIHDTMRAVRESTTIETIGLGKVMSAGVILLASGTEGRRQIGRNCRVMIHSILGGSHGSLVNIENEIEEMRWTQERYVKCLAAETKLSERKIHSMLKKQVDVYLSAEQAVEYGIADIII